MTNEYTKLRKIINTKRLTFWFLKYQKNTGHLLEINFTINKWYVRFHIVLLTLEILTQLNYRGKPNFKEWE